MVVVKLFLKITDKEQWSLNTVEYSVFMCTIMGFFFVFCFVLE